MKLFTRSGQLVVWIVIALLIAGIVGCPIGRTWNGQICKGESTSLDWTEAKKACPSGFRLPTVKEFTSLLGGCDDDAKEGRLGKCNSCRDSETCFDLFRSDIDCYWTSFTSDPEYAWNALLETGRIGWNRKASGLSVRCVRKTH